jgi:hypothetical protein
VRTNCRNCNKIKPLDSDNVYGNPRQRFECIDKKAIDSKVEKRLMVIFLNIPYAYNENDIISEINLNESSQNKGDSFFENRLGLLFDELQCFCPSPFFWDIELENYLEKWKN